MQETWRLIHDPPLPGKVNMARDLALLKEVCTGMSAPILRFYTWSPLAVSLGFFQKTEEVVEVKNCRRLGVDIVHRPTGGRALLHHLELTYSLIIPIEHPLLPKGVIESYKFLSQGIVKGFKTLGIKAELAPGEERGKRLAPGACFDSSSSYEIQISGKKTVGSAQLRRQGGLLQHGAILQELSLDIYRQVLKLSGEAANLDFLEKNAAGLKDLGYTVSEKELVQGISTGFAELFGVEFYEDEAEDKDEEEGERGCYSIN